MIKKGIFGGTFDPIHNGHIYIANEALSKLGLASVIFVPCGNPPHKTDKIITDANIRYEMVNMVVRNEERFQISRYEIDKTGYSYSYETLQYFNNKEKAVDWFFMTGADCLMELNTWKNVDEIMNSCKLVVFNRDGYSREEILIKKKQVEKYYKKEIILLDINPINISATNIRERIKNGYSTRHLLPNNIYNTILELNLYVG